MSELFIVELPTGKPFLDIAGCPCYFESREKAELSANCIEGAKVVRFVREVEPKEAR